VSLRSFFEEPTIAGLARVILAGTDERDYSYSLKDERGYSQDE
jgi:hypothetical protein